MARMLRLTCLMGLLLAEMLLAGCASPDQAGREVGRSLYDASVSTGHAIAVVGDRTGQALQNAGANLRGAANPPPRIAGPPPELPPPYVPDGFAPIGSEPLAPPPPPPPGQGM